MIVPFDQCIARPHSPNGDMFLLSDHLLWVASRWGSVTGTYSDRIKFLGGLMHDAGKMRYRWQRYILSVSGEKTEKSGERIPKVNHAPLGSALFFWSAKSILSKWDVPKSDLTDLRRLILNVSRDIYDHHGELGDLENDVPWADTLGREDLEECDIYGFAAFIEGLMPDMNLNWTEFLDNVDEARSAWEAWVEKTGARMQARLSASEFRAHHAAGHCIRRLTSGLIAADRYHASGIDANVNSICRTKALKAEQHLKEFVSDLARDAELRGVSREIIDRRQWVQEQCLLRYERNPNHSVYTLVLPTGMGKTLTATRLALRACALGHCDRIIYVAPYLSILSQATGDIRRATDLDVLEHHHLSVLSSQGREDAHESQELSTLESWLSPVVTTTFNQFFRCLFPRRAQHTMRLAALTRAFIIIDEPQIIDGAVWNLFLTMLEAMVGECQGRALLSTATLPAVHFGLKSRPLALAPENLESPNRYIIRSTTEPMDMESLVQMALNRYGAGKSVAVIMNTVKDAYQIYKCIASMVDDCRLLTGRMTGPHKAFRIEEIRAILKRNVPCIVVSTQVLECGVDLSFQVVLRALPVLPSVVQAAGRANRHGEGSRAEVIVFPFARCDGEDSRQYVYRSALARAETDACLAEQPDWSEPEASHLMGKYYGELIKRTTDTGRTEDLVKAAVGEWSAIGRVDPFGSGYEQVSVFVPYDKVPLPLYVVNLMEAFALRGPEDLYDKYLDRRFKAKLSFQARKLFMGLLQHFIVQLDIKVADRVVDIQPDTPIGRIVDPKLYRDDSGMAHIISGDLGDGLDML